MKLYAKAIVNVLLVTIVLLAAIFLLPKLLVFFLPFVVGWIIALMASPMVRFFEDKIKIKRNIGSAFVIITVIALVVLVSYLVLSELITQLIGWIGSLPDVWNALKGDFASINDDIAKVLNKLPFKIDLDIQKAGEAIGNYVSDFFSKLGTPTIEAAGNIAKSIPSVFIGVIMTLLSSYFFVADREKINEWFRKHTPNGIQEQYRKIRISLMRSVGGYFKAQIKIEIWIYVLLVVGLAILKVNYFALIALGIAFLDFLPVFGSGTVLLPWAVIRFCTADYKMTIGLLIIWGVGQLVRQLIQPKIVGDSVGVKPLPTLILLYMGYNLGGVVGMIVAVPLGIVLFTMYDEGAFDNLKTSLGVLFNGINNFRKFDDDEKK